MCCNNHVYLTTDPRLLQSIKPQYIPFILLHKSGFLKSFVNHVIGLIREGLCITAVERFIQSQRRATVASLSTQILSILSISEV